jgi:DNA modification methylase
MSNLSIKPDIRRLSVSDIKPDPRNPRKISEDAMSGLTKSLERFGLVDLIVVNSKNMQVVSGHQRLKVVKKSGEKHVYCLMVDLDASEQKALAVTMNNPAIMGEFTQGIIDILDEIRSEDADAYLELRMKELREQVNDLEVEKIGKTQEDDIPEAPEKSLTKKGDIWILGDEDTGHRLMCGSSRSREDIKSLMGGGVAKLFASDPPYLVDYTGAARPNGGKDWSEKFKEIDILDPTEFMRDYLTLGLEVCVENVAIYQWFAFKKYSMIEKVWLELGLLVHQQIVWVKPCSVLSFAIYPWKHEPCLFGWKQGNKAKFRVGQKSIGTTWELGLVRSGDPEDPEHYSDIWHLDWEGKKRGSTVADHPTVKPVECFAVPMRVHTDPGDICFEPFCGSGSQIIAAEKLGRRCFAMELETHFCDVAVKRWEEYTGQKATRIPAKGGKVSKK